MIFLIKEMKQEFKISQLQLQFNFKILKNLHQKEENHLNQLLVKDKVLLHLIQDLTILMIHLMKEKMN